MKIKVARTATNTAIAVYSRRMNAIDPSRMAFMSWIMRSFPGGTDLTCLAYTEASTNAATPMTTATYNQTSGFTDFSPVRRRIGKPPGV